VTILQHHADASEIRSSFQVKNIVFYTETQWVFGQIHYSLCKRLYEYGLNCEVLDFYKQYSVEEMLAICEHTDYFVTTPVGVGWLLNYSVPAQKIKSVAHAQWDLLLGNQQTGLDIYSQLAGYGVVSTILQKKSLEFGISVTPTLLPMGIDFDRYYMPISSGLTTVGFAGAFEARNFFGQEIKRGILVQQAAEMAQLAFRRPQCHYLAMPRFYQSVDCVIQASTEEGAGFPMLEAAAAGRLTIGTLVGYYEQNCQRSGGLWAPTESHLFLRECVGYLNFYKNHPDQYIRRCKQIQEYASEYYRWERHLDSWAKFLAY
jgi:hypothetical protein